MKSLMATKREPRIILNRIKCPDGTILTSYHRHDYKKHTDINGNYSVVDGGNAYLRRSGVYEELSVFSDAPYEILRESIHRGGRGKNGREEFTWTPMSEMPDEWLKSCIIYNEERNLENSFSSKMYEKELNYRIDKNIKKQN